MTAAIANEAFAQDRDRGDDANNRDNNQKLDQSKTTILAHVLSPFTDLFLQALCQVSNQEHTRKVTIFVIE